MSWSIGSIIVAAATYGYNKRNDEWAWRVPLALQWIFPVSISLAILNEPIPFYVGLIMSDIRVIILTISHYRLPS
jgi:hypothetical protein